VQTPSAVARKPASCPSPPEGREGARRADEGGITRAHHKPRSPPETNRQRARTLVPNPDPLGIHQHAHANENAMRLSRNRTRCIGHTVRRESVMRGTPTWGRHVPCQPQAIVAKSFRLGPQPPRCHEERRTRRQRRTWRHETDGDHSHVVPTGATHTRVFHGRSNRAPVVHSVIQHVPGSAPAWIVSFSTGGERRCPKGG